MAKVAPIITSFNSGEFSPLMAGRVDIKYYANACRRMRNFIPTAQGPARRRPGTRFVGEVKDSTDRTWLYKFEFNIEQAYVLEFGDQYIRFYANHAQVESSPGTPLEVASPWTAANLVSSDGTFALNFVQSGDVLYITHEDYAPRKLTRTGAAAFTLSTLSAEGGPFQDIDPDNTVTIYSSAATGNVTLTASANTFVAGHVGALILLEQKNADAITMWEPAKSINANDVRRSDGKNYTALNTATTGTIRPTHSVGDRYDGDTGVQWRFNDPGYGWAVITAVGGPTSASATVLSSIPAGAVGSGNATTRWAFGAWSDVEGWPEHVTFFRERLCFSRDRFVWMSVAGDFENFRNRDSSGLVTAEMGITSDITTDRANQIEWLAPADTALVVGTAGDEVSLSEITTTEALGPGNIRAKKQSEYGSRHVRPARVGDGIVFVQKAGRKVRDMQYSWEKEGYIARDVTVLAEHVSKGGVIEMAYQQEPDSVVWAARNDGLLLGLTLNREQDVRGWHPHRIGGYSNAAANEYAIVESVVSIPAPDGDRDEVWMIVNRYIDGATVRYIEWMEYHHEKGDNPEDAFYVDCGLTLDNTIAATLTPGTGATVVGTTDVVFTAGAAVFDAADVGKKIHYDFTTESITGAVTWRKAVAEITEFTDTTHVKGTIRVAWPNLTTIASGGWRMTVNSVSGLDHLEGQTVDVWANGAAHPQRVVSGGAITFQTSDQVSKAHVGLPCPAVLQPMPIEAGAQDGTAQGKKSRISRCVIRFDETSGCKYGRDEDLQLDRVELRRGSDPMDQAPALFTGDKVIAWPDGNEGPALITIVQDQPGPCTVVALMPQMTTYDDR